ncbi:hypothetical protein [Comamonas sp. MYb396]|uniref:hypothetical protein n=1 Tax=Comamonas sp. MYb396 TaxID=2745302 RepID=UPI0030949719
MPTIRRHALRHYAAISLLACTASWGPLASAQTPPVPFVAVNSLPIDEPTSYQVEGLQQRGPTFQTGAVPTRIQELTIGFDAGLPTTLTLSLYLLDTTTEFPTGTALASTTVNVDGTAAVTEVTTYSAAQLGAIATTTLQANQKYALILSNASESTGFTNDDATTNAYTFQGGFGPIGSGHVGTRDGGATWEMNEGTLAYSMTVIPYEEVIVVEPPAAPTPVPALGAMGLVSLVSVMGWVGLRRARKSA